MTLTAGDQPPLPAPGPAGQKVSNTYISLIVAAQFGVFVAFITPLAISLAIRVGELAPGREEYLGYITGSGALAVMVTAPFLGVLSDRTRTRLGRRRPWMIGGTVLGLISLVVMALAPSVLVLGFGWILAQLGWGQVLGNLLNSTADRLPEEQRGKVAGLGGFAQQIGPVFGVVLAGGLAGQNLLLFLVPGLIGAVLVAIFVIVVGERDSRGLELGDRLTLKTLGAKFLYDPRVHPDYSWNWLGRFLFYFGLALNTTFTAFFFAARLGVTVEEVAGLIAALGGAGVLATAAGAIGGGFLSDRLHRRRPFVLASGVVFGLGAVLMAVAPSTPLLFAGSLICSLGIGGFAAVDQALLLDVLPERDTDAGRFLAITGFATSIPQAAGPFVAPIFLAIGTGDGEKNYTLLYVVAAVCTVLGGLVVLRIKSVK
ncbi:putative MFS transporter [Actinoplanes missouriensis 431]|uniref:Putative MFS transporter n=1 Tax=Actinoplanes missouriensis (strain ATCC 14538 / DSM 43046 / CBS 188.64 / JCM 3121 / NBRC 102363 / NCIMB 12654 / NRRL B-3342 / UNCC 431) TaxID=512565 RepID=I0H578_ACTM4|nr:MFS transporter [Actinoplanes missouriensis]BAL88165.1 putative MFS transporter [Actinoplanes missouriensis 431]